MENSVEENLAVKVITKVDPGDFINISQGQMIIFGGDPGASPDIKFADGGYKYAIEEVGLSPGAVALSIDRTGQLIVKALTEDNTVSVNQYQTRRENGKKSTRRFRDSLYKNDVKRVPDNTVVDINVVRKINNGILLRTLIRLNPAGGSQGITKNLKFRIDVNPPIDLNALPKK